MFEIGAPFGRNAGFCNDALPMFGKAGLNPGYGSAITGYSARTLPSIACSVRSSVR